MASMMGGRCCTSRERTSMATYLMGGRCYTSAGGTNMAS